MLRAVGREPMGSVLKSQVDTNASLPLAAVTEKF
jgi:hypothetical protein